MTLDIYLIRNFITGHIGVAHATSTAPRGPARTHSRLKSAVLPFANNRISLIERVAHFHAV